MQVSIPWGRPPRVFPRGEAVRVRRKEQGLAQRDPRCLLADACVAAVDKTAVANSRVK